MLIKVSDNYKFKLDFFEKGNFQYSSEYFQKSIIDTSGNKIIIELYKYSECAPQDLLFKFEIGYSDLLQLKNALNLINDCHHYYKSDM